VCLDSPISASRLLLEYIGICPASDGLVENPGSEDILHLPPGSTFAISLRGLMVERSADGDVRIFSAYVARRHARLWLTDEGVGLEDLRSTNGTTVNGVRVNRAILHEGDRITIAGMYQFRLILPLR
jgi:hypothetical protein